MHPYHSHCFFDWSFHFICSLSSYYFASAVRRTLVLFHGSGFLDEKNTNASLAEKVKETETEKTHQEEAKSNEDEILLGQEQESTSKK